MGILGKIIGKKTSAGRVACIGLDGTPHTLIKDLIAKGAMPNLARIAGEGTLLQMDTSIPEISNIAWTTFATGTNPASHGIYGFMDLAPDSYKMYFPNARHVKAPTLWSELTAAGKRSIVINVPATYPAGEINGVLVAGFVAISLEKATWPKDMIPELQQMGYRIDVDTVKAREDTDFLLRDLAETLDARRRFILRMLDEDWSFFIGVVTGTDRLQHFLWDAYEDPKHGHHADFINYYTSVDSLIGEVADRLGDGVTLMIFSDHGFTGIRQEVYLNHWLEREGYLKFAKDKPTGFEDMDPSSRAFALDPSRIYIHRKDRYPNGTVEPGEQADRLRDEIAGRILEIKGDDDEPVIRQVHRKQEIYSGPFLDRGPDLVLLSKWGYDLKGALGRENLMGRTVLTGMHTQDDAFFCINRRIEREAKINIADLRGMILEDIPLS